MGTIHFSQKICSTRTTKHKSWETVTIPTQDSSLAMEPLMQDLLEQQLELRDNLLQTRSLTHAPEVAPETKIPTTESLVETLETSFWELLQDLQAHQLLMLLPEVLVEDKIFQKTKIFILIVTKWRYFRFWRSKK